MNDFYSFRAEAVDEPTSAELLIFDVIGNWEDMGEVSAKAFARDLSKLPTSVKRLDIHINSPGGSLFEASAIYSRLADHRADKIVFIDGLAASAASIIAMVGHKIYIRANACMMIHLPSGLVLGNADDMRKMATALDSVTESMINVYAKRTGLERNDIRELLANETWFNPQEAIEKGFADEMRGVVKAAASLENGHAIFNGTEFDLSRFHNVPEFTGQKPPTKGTMKTKVKAQTAAEETPPKNGNGEEAKEETPPTKPAKEETPPTEPSTEPSPPPAKEPEAPKPQTAARAAYDQGVQAERARVTALQALDRPATHAIIEAAIKDGKQVSDIYIEVFDVMEKAAKQDARRADASGLNGIPASDGGEPGAINLGAVLTKSVKARLKHRGLRTQRN
jgi:ATP-dependent protease ClpP protease subunit